jgi:phosphatidylglycerol:prolipoprotein diacylglycerol transferase
MYNDLLKLGPVTVHGYGLMIAIGILLALSIAGIRAKKKNLDPNVVFGLGLAVLVCGFIGAKLLYCLVDLGGFLKDPIRYISGSGFVVYGGIIGGILAAVIYCKIKRVSFLQYFDLMAPSVAIAQGFGRIGCFLAGCCYGRETDSFLGIVFQHSLYAPNGVKLLPTQLFSSAGDFLIAGILLLFSRKSRIDGKTGALYLVLYGVGRFIIEFFRNDYRGNIGFLSTSQFISIIIALAGLGLLLYKPNALAAERQ